MPERPGKSKGVVVFYRRHDIAHLLRSNGWMSALRPTFTIPRRAPAAPRIGGFVLFARKAACPLLVARVSCLVVQRAEPSVSPGPLTPAVIGIVENDEVFRTEVVRRLDPIDLVRAPVRAWNSAELFLRDSGREQIDLLFVDIMLPGISGIELARMLHVSNPSIRIVMLTNLNSDEMIFESIKNGALGYVLKSELGDLEQALGVVLGGGALITPTIALRVFSNFRKSPKGAPELSDRERQVLELMVRGKTVRSVADFLCLSPHTIHDHVKRIYKKLEVHSRSELILRAQELSLM